MKYLHTQPESGFTLVETLVAITILLIVVTGPMTISMSTARSTTYASEQVVAFFLAQEGAEIAQKARDEFLLDGLADGTPADPWSEFIRNNGIFANCFTTVNPSGCGLELNTNAGGTLKAVRNCGTAGCTLYYNPNGGRSRYTYDNAAGNERTVYSRVVQFSIPDSGADNWDVQVISTVTWRTGNLREQQQVRVETHLFDVYEN